MTGPQPLSFPEAQARNQASYDEFPYISHAFPQTHPARLAAIGTLFGLQMPAIETSRVLEIGCASGGNIIPLASAYPKARFLGVDLSSIQIEDGRRRIESLGLTNIELSHQDISSFKDPGHRFDFIICHGVYSWVQEAVRHAILEICSRYLEYRGVALVSYNVLPGWRPKQVLRDALMAHVGHVNNQRERVAKAREFMGFLSQHMSGSPYGAAVKDGVAELQKSSDEYLAHEFLELDNEPCTFRDFMHIAGQHKLAFLGEAEINMMVPDNFGAELGKSLRMLSSNDLLATESYVDVITGRTFRQTLLINPARAMATKRMIDPSQVEKIHLVADISEVASTMDGYPFCFQNRNGRQLHIRSAVTRKAFALIAARAPATSALRQVIADLEADGEKLSTSEKADISASLLRGVLLGLFGIRSTPVTIGPRESAAPAALALARGDAAAGRTRSANLRHESMDLSVVAQHLLPILDGTRDRKDLHAHLIGRVEAGLLHFQRNGVPITDQADIAACATEHLDNTLETLWRNCMLEA